MSDNLAVSVFPRPNADLDADIAALLERFPRLKDRIDSRARLLFCRDLRI